MNSLSHCKAVSEARSSIPACAGIGLRAPHHRELLSRRLGIDWVEVHSENFFGAGGLPLEELSLVREHYPVSLHGVGLSIGSTDPLDREHLQKLKNLVNRIEPGFVSEHLAWSAIAGQHFNDLLPLPYTEEALRQVISNVNHAQDVLGRQILLENISSYLEFEASTIPEWEFLVTTATETGCGILLDINNVYVAACNHGFDPMSYLRTIPEHLVGEIHLAGFTEKSIEGSQILIDTHSCRVAPEVWALYSEVIARFGPRPTLIEWDTELPTLDTLLDEAAKAQGFLEVSHGIAA